MANSGFVEHAPPAGAAAPGAGKVPFGTLAYVAAGLSVATCFTDVLLELAAPLLGLPPAQVNIHLQAVLMWGLGLVAVAGLYRDRRAHRRNGPLATALAGVAVIVATLYGYYDVRILILGYLLLVTGVLLNPSALLASLNRAVRAQADRLADLNTNLEHRVSSQVSEIERLARLKRFLSPRVADLITSEGREALLDIHRRQVACLFCDVRNFTAFSEAVEPEEVMNVLRVVHEEMGTLVERHGGTITHRAGDGLMVVFNDPLPCERPVLRAVDLALDMNRTFERAREQWRRLGHDLGLGVGISHGYATLGMIGSEGRYDYTAIGNVVNVAARLCDRAADGEILIDKRALLEVEGEGEVDVEPVGAVTLKGVTKPVELFRVVGLRAEP